MTDPYFRPPSGRRVRDRAVTIALGGLLLLAQGGAALAEDYFIPGQAPAPAGQKAQPKPRPKPAPPQAAAPAPAPAGPPVGAPGTLGGDPSQPVSVQLPAVPDLPALPKGASPPVAVVGVIGVVDVLRGSSAAQRVERVIGERRQKLNEDAQKEQAAWRDMQQALAAQRSTLSADQARTKERELQDRVTNAQKQFRERDKIIQEAEQAALGQVERMLASVIRQVADSHGMNLVLHKNQVALNSNDFDITGQVAEQLNKLLPSVPVPPDGVAVSPVASNPAAGATPVAAAAAPAPAPAPATAAPADTGAAPKP